MVHSDAYGGVVFAANAQKRHKPLVYLAQFSGIFLVGILQVFERAGRVYVVAGVHSHLLSVQCSHVSHVGIEVYVGHQGHHIAVSAQCSVDVAEVFSLLHALRSEPYVLATGIHNALGLRH